MRFWILAICAAFLSSQAHSQNVQVRSGQHEAFTRLIVDLPERVPFEIEYGVDTAKIIFQRQELSFDTTPVFSRIPRERIADVSSTSDNTLLIKLGCDCEVISFWHSQSLLVLDIQEAEESVLLKESTPPDETVVAQPVRRIPLATAQSSSSLAASLVDFGQATERVEATNQNPVAPPVNKRSDVVGRQSLDVARGQLAAQIGRAASQGLLSPRTSGDRVTDFEPGSSNAPDASPDAIVNKDEAMSHVNLHAQSSVDRDFSAIADRVKAHARQSVCMTAGKLDVGTWGTEASFAEQIGSLRLRLTNEVDVLDPIAAIQLAKLYLFYGFGPEAQAVLNLLEDAPQDTEMLRSIASIMEHGHVVESSQFSDQLDCDNAAALWSILSHKDLPVDTPIDTDAALRAFETLPRHLRAHLGPDLSRRLLDAGHKKAADNVVRILNRHKETVSADADLVAAEIDLNEGQTSTAIEGMENVVSSNSEPSAEAIIGLIDAKIETGSSVSYDQAVLAGAYAQQYRETGMRSDLIRVYLLGLASSGAFDQAFNEFEKFASEMNEKTDVSVKSIMLNQLTKKADDITFVRIAMAEHQDEKNHLAPETANLASNRLFELGFPTLAKDFIETEAIGEKNKFRKLLRAKILLAENKPQEAARELAELEGADATVLKAHVRNAMGDHVSAASLFSETGDSEQSLRQSWLAEDWPRLANSENQAMAGVAALVVANTPERSATESDAGLPLPRRVLSENLNLIQESSATRDTIEEVLQAAPSPTLLSD